jgi:sialic acid synthase SpsE
MKILIAEIGNNAFGSLEKAKELIQAASESGAMIVKGQAYTKGAVKGSMPEEFYEASRFTEMQYIELMDYADKLKIPMFYSIFLNSREETGLDNLIEKMSFHKCAASQTKTITEDERAFYDFENCFVSVPEDLVILPFFEHAKIMHVSKYLTESPNLDRITMLSRIYGRSVGYSDHTEGVHVCMEAIRDYEVRLIEKHFTLEKNESWKGQVFRDTIHGATPKEFSRLSKYLMEAT